MSRNSFQKQSVISTSPDSYREDLTRIGAPFSCWRRAGDERL
ncbi:hypothetical protein [Leeuwenhoekiella palythoae]|nr:hypothetical protein [Leeuwenhoekiella palythoae]